MKIRQGFVTNSSSTSFLILSKKELTMERLLSELGFTKGSPIYDEGHAFVYDMMYHLEAVDEDRTEEISDEFGSEMLALFREKKGNGWYAYIGRTASDDSTIASYFTLDSTIVCNPRMIIDARQCLW